MIRRRVIKVGGSLFDLPDLAERIGTWLADRPPLQNVFLAGGGEFCNQVRDLDRLFGFQNELSHELSIELMKVTGKILSALIDLKVVDCLDSIHQSNYDTIFECSHWLQSKKEIPMNWDLTSDSIGALLAQDLGAELCLLKSTDSQAAVDNFFPTASEGLKKIEWVNLRKFQV